MADKELEEFEAELKEVGQAIEQLEAEVEQTPTLEQVKETVNCDN